MQRLNYLVVQDTFLVSLKSICKGHSHWLSKYSSWSLMGLYGDLKQTKADQGRPRQTKVDQVKILASWGKSLGEHTLLPNAAFFGGDLHNLCEMSA